MTALEGHEMAFCHRNSEVKIGVRIVCPNTNTDFSVTVRKLDIFNKKQNKTKNPAK